MVSDNSDGVVSSLKVLPPLLEGFNDGEEFSIVFVVVAGCRGKGAREIGARV